jgi:hypothetical protein
MTRPPRERLSAFRYIASIGPSGAARPPASAANSFGEFRIMKRSAFACAAMLGALSLQPAPDARAADIALRGVPSCALWIKGREQNDAKYEKTWLTGYFSGLAIGLDVNFWGPKGSDELDPETVWKWMDGYCAANAQNSLVHGAEKLFLERANKLIK